MLKSFVEFKFEICSIYKAQCAKEYTPLKFTELIQETRDTSATQGLEVALENNSVKCLSLRSLLKCFWTTSFSSFQNLFQYLYSVKCVVKVYVAKMQLGSDTEAWRNQMAQNG